MKNFSGFLKKEFNFFDLNLDKVDLLFNDLYEMNRSDTYPNVASFDLDEALNDIFLSEIFGKIKSNFSINEYVLKKVWLVSSKTETISEGELPFVPHIDKQRYLKFMIYVTDVSEEDGPFSYCEEVSDTERYESFRRRVFYTKKVIKKNQIKEFKLKSYNAVLGKKGDVIVFDTNIPHFAGAIPKDGERKVIRFDFEKEEWNKKSLFNRLKGCLFK